jgi:hypothetical protein
VTQGDSWNDNGNPEFLGMRDQAGKKYYLEAF